MVDLAAMSKDHEYWMAQALDLADEAARRDEVPIGAILVGGDDILGRGYNLREATGRTVAHAEILAIEDYNDQSGEWRLPAGTRLYVTAEPCLMCTGALIWARVEEVYYGCRDTKNASGERLRPLIESGAFDHRFKSFVGGIFESRCAETLSQYFRQKRAVKNGIWVAPSKVQEGHDELQPDSTF